MSKLKIQMKFQITSTKSQINPKFQYPNSKPSLVLDIGILVIGAYLGFGI
jgi:hypothetical protein